MVRKIDELEREYCPPLDAPTFYAIISDFDLERGEGLADAKATLDALKASADAEDTAGFDPSGSSNPKDVAPGTLSSVTSRSEDADVRSGESTGITDATSSLDAFTFDDHVPYDKGIDAMSVDDKKALLREMFRTLKPFDVDYAFNKRKGDFGATVEDLLNQQYLHEDAIANGNGTGTPKGIEGFASMGLSGRKPKGKAKGRGKHGSNGVNAMDLNNRLVEGSSSSSNRWQKGHDDVQFITSRTQLKESLVRSMYNASGHSLRATLLGLCKKSPKDLSCHTDPEDTMVQTSMVDLASEFPSVPTPCLRILVLLTHPLFINAKQLAEVIASGPGESLIPQYAATEIPDTGAHTEVLEDESSFLAAAGDLPIGASYTSLRASAFAQASAAYRKSRSSPHMGGAAMYYASVGHAANAAVKRERALEANARVAQQSSPDACDLHGVTVLDATRIAKQYVERWWQSRQEWAREGKSLDAGRSDVYRVVVGRGSHSAEKKGRLGPAVEKMLKAEGWRVEVQIGEIIVRGRARK